MGLALHCPIGAVEALKATNHSEVHCCPQHPPILPSVKAIKPRHSELFANVGSCTQHWGEIMWNYHVTLVNKTLNLSSTMKFILRLNL